VASRSGSRRGRELSRQSEGVEKQAIRRRASEHAYQDKEREEWVEEDRTPALCTLFLAGRGRGER